MNYADRHVKAVLFAVAVSTLPHLWVVPYWIAAVCVASWMFVLAAGRFGWPMPGRRTLMLLAGASLVGTLASHGGRFTTDAAVALLALMAAFKLLELKGHRDRMITVILCYFLIVGGLFFSNSLAMTVYMLVSVLCTTAVLVHVNRPTGGLVHPLRLSGSIMLQALPLVLILFVLFPRIQGSLWGRSVSNMARTGFSDTMSPGDIARLAKSDAVAFRVEFEGERPPTRQLYWRGIVLWDFDGKTWTRGSGRHGPRPRNVRVANKVTYKLTLEPHYEHWLFTLDLPRTVTARAWPLRDFLYYRRRPVSERMVYEGTSYLEHDTSATTPLLARALKLPAEGNARTRDLALKWAREAGNRREFVDRVLAHFHEQPFHYTLEAPALGKNRIDDFLFNTRRGFCEHYASTFAFIMRAAGVPARIVAGYQGGGVNPYGGYLVVTQGEAHAWCEVWFEDTGWTRVDPTRAVAPSRVELSVDSALAPGERDGLLGFLAGGSLGDALDTAGWAWDYVNNRWNLWVMGYSRREQVGVLSRIGVDVSGWKGPAKALVLSLLGVAVVAFVISFFMLRGHREAGDDVARAYSEFCGRLARSGLPRRESQGPLDYAEEVARKRPDLAPQARDIAKTYARLRFGRGGSPEAVESLKAMVSRFRPGKTEKRRDDSPAA
ncbi:MAG: DUF3488 and DUF4129 domain-containing transglutaminase family protein [Desulfatibacillaceae bacterium]